MTLSSKDGRNYTLRPGGTIQSYQGPSGQAQLDSSGKVRGLKTKDVYVNRSALGEHLALTRAADGGTVVSLGPNRGYVEHQVLDHGRPMVVRTELANGQSSTSLYRQIAYGNSHLLLYQPTVVYSPAFYGWFSISWRRPVPYVWTSNVGPGPTAYAGYYAPATTYTTPSAWAADYVLTSNLNQAYANPYSPPTASTDTAAADDDLPVLAAPVDAPVTPKVRQQIIDQVGREMHAESQAAKLQDVSATLPSTPPARPIAPQRNIADPGSQETPAVLDPAVQVFIVHTTLQVATGTQQCQLSQGDILLHPQPVADRSGTADLTVQSSRKGDCPANIYVHVPIRDLQEMSNRFRESIASCAATAADQQGKQLPTAPDPKPQKTSDLASNDPKRDATALAEVEQLQSHAVEEETSLEQEIGTNQGEPK